MPSTIRRSRPKMLLAATTAATVSALGLAVAATSSASEPVYLRPSASPQTRAQDLLERLSLTEKIGQLVQIQVGELYGDGSGYNPGPLNVAKAQQVLGTDAVGSILSGGGDVPGEGYYPNTPKTWATQINALEKYAIAHSPHHIPIVYGADVVHGHNDVVGTTLFPQQIGLGSSWDPSLVRHIQQSAGRAAAANH